MNTDRLNSCSLHELWKLHQEVASKLAEKLSAEKARLDERKLGAAHQTLNLIASVATTHRFVRSIRIRRTGRDLVGSRTAASMAQAAASRRTKVKRFSD